MFVHADCGRDVLLLSIPIHLHVYIVAGAVACGVCQPDATGTHHAHMEIPPQRHGCAGELPRGASYMLLLRDATTM